MFGAGARLKEAMIAANVPALVITDMANIRWLTGFTGSYAVVFATPEKAILITDGRYIVQAKAQVVGAEVTTFAPPNNLNGVLDGLIKDSGASKIAFESSVSYAHYKGWSDRHPSLEWVSCGELLSNLRKIKAPEEMDRIRAACQLADVAMERALSMVQVGVSELDIAIDLEFYLRRQGAAASFETIVASGPNSAKPHARPSERKIERGDFVTIDMGALLDGYCSDFTRTVVVGHASERHELIYNQVLKAEIAGCNALIPGANGKDIDTETRRILDEHDLSKYYTHSLGHGLGLLVHDPGRLSISADEPILAGQVWTVEPGVYIEGFGGVRIEDDVYVSAGGPVILTKTPKDLLIV